MQRPNWNLCWAVKIGRVRVVVRERRPGADVEGIVRGPPHGDWRAGRSPAQMHAAAATAREVLLEMASRRLSVPVPRLSIADGVKRKPPSAWTTLGKPVTSLDRVALVTGGFEYVHHVRVPGMLHGRVVRPPEMGATLAGVVASSDGVVRPALGISARRASAVLTRPVHQSPSTRQACTSQGRSSASHP